MSSDETPAHGPNRVAAEQTVANLRGSGLIDADSEAIAAAFLALATAVDQPDAKAELWREYRAFGNALREAASGGSDDDTQDFLISVRTPVRHAKES